jgi:2-dehydropantoate 2-reductase
VKFAVLGAGAIGAYAGAALARGGADVTLIARGAHLAAMASRGVRVLSPRGDFTARPRATDDLAAVADANVVLVALKAYSLPGIAPRLGELLAPGAAAIWAQNGIPWWYFQGLPDSPADNGLQSVDPGGVIARSIGPEHNVGCVVYCSTEIVEPGVIRHIEGTRFTLGEPDGSLSPRCRQISAAFAAGGLRAPVEARLRDQIWLKLVGNVAFNPITALTRATLGELGSLPEMHDRGGGRARRAARHRRPARPDRARLRQAPRPAGSPPSAHARHRPGPACLVSRTGQAPAPDA